MFLIIFCDVFHNFLNWWRFFKSDLIAFNIFELAGQTFTKKNVGYVKKKLFGLTVLIFIQDALNQRLGIWKSLVKC